MSCVPTHVQHSTGRIFCMSLARGVVLPDNCDRKFVCMHEGRGREREGGRRREREEEGERGRKKEREER